MRIQFYPNTDLENKLNVESTALGVSVSVLVNDILNKHYGLIPPDTLTDVEIEQKVFDELRAYVKKAPSGEFDLNMGSHTYKNIDMVYAGKPRILKATLGRKFAGMLGTGDFINVEQVLINGTPKRTVGNRAAIYRINTSTKTSNIFDDGNSVNMGENFYDEA